MISNYSILGQSRESYLSAFAVTLSIKFGFAKNLQYYVMCNFQNFHWIELWKFQQELSDVPVSNSEGKLEIQFESVEIISRIIEMNKV